MSQVSLVSSSLFTVFADRHCFAVYSITASNARRIHVVFCKANLPLLPSSSLAASLAVCWYIGLNVRSCVLGSSGLVGWPTGNEPRVAPDSSVMRLSLAVPQPLGH